VAHDLSTHIPSYLLLHVTPPVTHLNSHWALLLLGLSIDTGLVTLLLLVPHAAS
jgi:hypothetical protein